MSHKFHIRTFKPIAEVQADVYATFCIVDDCDADFRVEIGRLTADGIFHATGFNETTRVNIVSFGAVADWNGVSGTDNIDAFDDAIAFLKDAGGGELIIPSGLAGYWLGADWTIEDANGITITQESEQYNRDFVFPTKGRIVFTNAAHGVRVINAYALNFIGVQIDGRSTSINPLSVDRMHNSYWENVTVYDCVGTACKLFDTTGVDAAGVSWCTFVNCNFDRCAIGFELTGVLNYSGVFHTTFIDTRIDYSGAAGIKLVSADNIQFIDTFTYRRSGSGVGVLWVLTSGYYCNSIYFRHLQGTISVPIGAYYPGEIDGYDMANGQPFPTLPAGTIMPISTSGINSVGASIPEEILPNAFTRLTGTAGKWIRDDNNYGIGIYNSSSGNAVVERLDDSSRAYFRFVNLSGSAFVNTSKEHTTYFATLGGMSPGSPAGAFSTGRIWYKDTGAPSTGGSNGDTCIRGDGTAAGKTIFYHKEAGSWVPAIP